MDSSYSAICGITEEEMLTQMDSDVDMAGHTHGTAPRSKLLRQLKAQL